MATTEKELKVSKIVDKYFFFFLSELLPNKEKAKFVHFEIFFC